ncbi:hypothetical protein [Levilactobacillus fuyuanensis]|uniref:Uncharacterized protein n=1 Tax=Levilactobacillus fuyuanensis TaxID=2486022 RepID=A0ABW4H3R8_9LACO|nr:hypothetical protein [Levilactobacillus fuyuanensis]
MTEQSAWLRQQIDQLANQQSKFTDRAFWLALKRVVAEQDRRSEQLGGEVDGRTWRPDRW